MHYIKQMKHNFVFSFLFFHLPWERVQREEPKCRCNPAPTAVGDRHVQLSASRWPLDFQQADLMLLDHFHLNTCKIPGVPYFLSAPFSPAVQICCSGRYLTFCTSGHLSCTMSSPDNQELKGQEQFLSHTRCWKGLERYLRFCLSTSEELLKTV